MHGQVSAQEIESERTRGRSERVYDRVRRSASPPALESQLYEFIRISALRFVRVLCVHRAHAQERERYLPRVMRVRENLRGGESFREMLPPIIAESDTRAANI